MQKIKLILPDTAYAEQLMAYRQEFLENTSDFAGCGSLRTCTTAKAWFLERRLLSDPNLCPEDRVMSDTYFAVRPEDDRLVGIIEIRHHIDHPILGLWGGHIGYSVRPGERRKGYATEMLRQSLAYCRNLGLQSVMVTCDHDNIGSEKTILANGGQFEKEVLVDGSRIKRYWITVS